MSSSRVRVWRVTSGCFTAKREAVRIRRRGEVEGAGGWWAASVELCSARARVSLRRRVEVGWARLSRSNRFVGVNSGSGNSVWKSNRAFEPQDFFSQVNVFTCFIIVESFC